MARTTTETRRTRGGAVAVTPGRAIVRDLGGPPSRFEVKFEVRTAYDFVISLNVAAGQEADLLPEHQQWLDRAKTAIPADILTDLNDCFGGSAASAAVYALPTVIVSRGNVRTASDLVKALDDITPSGLARLFLEDLLRYVGLTHLTDAVMAGDEAAVAEVRSKMDDEDKASNLEFVRSPEEGVQRVRTILGSWLPLFTEIEPYIRQMLERDVAERRPHVGTLDPATLIERTTGGLRWFPEQQVRRVIMAPSYFARPYNYIYQGADWRLFAYPLADSALGSVDPMVPPTAVVRLYRALGDSTRMRILRLLSDRDWYLTELAQQLELSKPTMKHHLALLRAAGLVTVTEEGSLTYYSLRRERLEEAGVELQRFLG